MNGSASIKLHVVTANDFPIAVIQYERQAKAYCVRRNQERTHIHYRFYPFRLNITPTES